MRCLRCGVCCKETEMLLSIDDIVRLEKKGFSKKFFVRYEDGYAILKNQQGYCVFYNVKEHKCNVYVDRPKGCRVYPVILDEATGIIIDDICCAQQTITQPEKLRKGKIVIRLLKKIDLEAQYDRYK
jgi:Fe-S-cluster containining protein